MIVDVSEMGWDFQSNLEKSKHYQTIETGKSLITTLITKSLHLSNMEVDTKTIHRKSTPTSVSDSSEEARIRRPSFWEKQKQICEAKKLVRTVHQRRCNPDYKIAHPAECRGNSEGDGLTVHPEAQIRILKEIHTKIQNANPPPVPHIARFNRS